MEYKYLISVIMPTYNSEKTIKNALESVRKQTIDQSKIEILIIDGGSTDKTLEIAQKYNITFLENKKRLPEFAKHIGIMNAKGKYGMFLDSDEIFENNNSFQRRIDFLEKNIQVKNLVSTGIKCKKGESGIVRYVNYIGDAFTYFVYKKYNGYNRLESMCSRYPYDKKEDGYIFNFKKAKYLPLFDGVGNMFHINSSKKIYEMQGCSDNFTSNIFTNMVTETKIAGMLDNDFVYHVPKLTQTIYRSKLRWRVKNNLFATEGVGYAERVKTNNYLDKRRYLFIFYNILIFPVLFDTLQLVIKNRDFSFFAHIYYSMYLLLVICWYMSLKILHIPVKMDKSYGKHK